MDFFLTSHGECCSVITLRYLTGSIRDFFMREQMMPMQLNVIKLV